MIWIETSRRIGSTFNHYYFSWEYEVDVAKYIYLRSDKKNSN